MYETMQLCVGCKACRRECPTGVDMNRMKTEFLYHYNKENGISFREKLFSYLPRYAHILTKFGKIINLRDEIPGLSLISEKILGISSKRKLPKWDENPFSEKEASLTKSGSEVVLFADSFNTYFEPNILRDALLLLENAGKKVLIPSFKNDRKKLCCGRTFLSSGLIDEAKIEAEILLENLYEYVERGIPIVGLEPSCIFTIKDEFSALIPGEKSKKLAQHVQLLEEYFFEEIKAHRLKIKKKKIGSQKVIIHGHCHQKAFDSLDVTVKLLKSIEDVEVDVISSSCCGMAGSFGYQSENYEVSMKMAELSLLPRIRNENENVIITASGTSCRQQINHGTDRTVIHPVSLLLELCSLV